MKYRLAIAALAATTGTALPAQTLPRAQTQAGQPAQPPAAQPVPTRATAAVLTRICAEERSACLTYILGAADAFSAALVASGRPQVFCIPRGTTNDQVAQTVVAFLRANPAEAQTNAAMVVLAGLSASYRCGY